MNVAVIGASNDRTKFGNKAVRAYLHAGHDVYPVNLHEKTIEGLRAWRSIADIPVDIDTTLVYLPPEITRTVLADIAAKGTAELYLNPGSEDETVVQSARALGLEPLLACSIVAIGDTPSRYGA